MTNKPLPRSLNLRATLAFIIFTTLGLNVVFKTTAVADGIPGVVHGTETGSQTGPDFGDQPITTPAEDAYTEAMLAGYAAAEAGDFQAALNSFQQALEERPGDRYALAAIENMETYLAQQRVQAERRQRFISLQQTLDQAIQASDWACAAATVDELITFVPPDSLERARLVAYRGELSALIDARVDIDNWSTVCPGG